MESTSALDGQPRRVLAGRYLLQGLLGQGGMADVELAFDQVLDRQVAAKMLHARYVTDPSFLQRFRREAQAAASLNHPNVVAVYDTGDSDGRPFIVMEYVRGRSLRDVLRVEEVLPERAAEMVAEASLALHYAHERGLVHRDVKPANIMINDDGRVKVTDFGIARAMNAETVTQTATVFGTAAYISPEQAQGERVDRRSDIYSLGVVLYEMLAHRPPFEGDSAVALAYKHVSEDPISPSRLNPEVSPQLDAVVRKAMAKHPSDRYQTARELHDDLLRAVSGMTVSALPPPAAYATTRMVNYSDDGNRTMVAPPYAPGRVAEPTPSYAPPPRRRARVGWTLLVVAVLALFGVAGYFVWGFVRNEPIAYVEVPDVVTYDLPQAQQILTGAGFQTTVAGFEASNQPQGRVIRTDPEAGANALDGSLVRITASSGPIVVPDVAGRSPEDAGARLSEAGLTPGALADQASDSVRPGVVIATDPPGGTPVGPRTKVTLIVSTGPSGIILPEVDGLDPDGARERILALCPQAQPDCVHFTTERVPNEDVDKGEMISTEPAPGEQAPLGGTITLIVSDGPAPTPAPTPEPDPTEPEKPSEPPPSSADVGAARPPSGRSRGLLGLPIPTG